MLIPDNFLQKNKDEMEKQLLQMDLSEQASLLLMSPWEHRYDILMASTRVRELVREMPVQELFWTVKAVGPADSIELLELATPEQLQFFLDLDIWRKDELRHDKILAWLTILAACEKTVQLNWIRWIMENDPYFLPAIIRPLIKLEKRPDDMDIQEARDVLGSFTLEDIYFISFKKDETTPLLIPLLKDVADIDFSDYALVMETILYETPTVNLETAFQRRVARLNDAGIPDYFESVDIYARVPLPDVREVELKWYENQDAIMPAFVPTLYMGQYRYLYEAISELAQQGITLERILLEWVWAANKIMMVENVDFDDPAAIYNAIDRASAFLNLGIEMSVAGRQGLTPGRFLHTAVIEDVIRMAVSSLRKMGDRLQRLMEEGLLDSELLYLPDPLPDVVRGLIKLPPVMWNEKSNKYEAFSSLGQLKQAQAATDSINNLAQLASRINPHWSTWPGFSWWRKSNYLSCRAVTWQAALATCLARNALYGEVGLAPVKSSELVQLKRLWPAEDGRPSEASRTSVQHFLDAMAGDVCPDEFLADTANAILNDVCMELVNIKDNFSQKNYLQSLIVI